MGWFMVFSTTFSYIVVVRFIGGGNWDARIKQPTCLKSGTIIIQII
jgi:hypothetical protein